MQLCFWRHSHVQHAVMWSSAQQTRPIGICSKQADVFADREMPIDETANDANHPNKYLRDRLV